jgi:helix-turn-helix, Psq domain
MTALNKEFAAEAIVDAMFTTDAKASEKYGISTKTLQRYRKRLAEGDPQLSGFVHTKKAERDLGFELSSDELPLWLRHLSLI